MKKISLFAIAGFALSQVAMAHTGIQYNTITEGTTNTYEGFTISHGCATNAGPEGTNGVQKDVIASSFVFPNGAGAVVKKVNADGTDGDVVDLSTVINGTVGGVFSNLSPTPVMPSVFPRMKVIYDANGNARGLSSFAIAANSPTLPGSKAIGLQPFRIAGVTFKTDASNCATALKVRFAVANWCLKGKANDADPARADIWIGHMTTKFNDPSTMPYNATDMAAGKFYWPTLTINRDLVNHPLDPSCGAGYVVSVAPSDADIDTYLPIPKATISGFWPSN